jgi:hypothetical protein
MWRGVVMVFVRRTRGSPRAWHPRRRPGHRLRLAGAGSLAKLVQGPNCQPPRRCGTLTLQWCHDFVSGCGSGSGRIGPRLAHSGLCSAVDGSVSPVDATVQAPLGSGPPGPAGPRRTPCGLRATWCPAPCPSLCWCTSSSTARRSRGLRGSNLGHPAPCSSAVLLVPPLAWSIATMMIAARMTTSLASMLAFQVNSGIAT